MSSSSTSFVLASRASKFAQIQTNIVRNDIEAAFPVLSSGTSFMTTKGNKNQYQTLYLLSGKALWTKELEVALKENVVVLVHSEGCVQDPTGWLRNRGYIGEWILTIV
ncbi:hypothetical protein F4604DRAFT_1711450 [Suillus subluteus]|nr:hypothetical protein F4604DRAFT_1711450 [Suillus subluteus]